MCQSRALFRVFFVGLFSTALLACQVNTNQAQSDKTQLDQPQAEHTQNTSTPRDGQPVIEQGEIVRVWDQQLERWGSVESFWQQYGQRASGKHWGQSSDYPTYADVNELDTLIIERPTGVCLMEFWHSRWRRANDVRRWHPAFNEHSACADVFK